MKTQIFDNTTFMVGEDDLILEVGDDIPLTDEEKEALAKIRKTEAAMMLVKQDLINTCHMADKNYVLGLGDMAHELSSLGIDHVYLMSRFVNDVIKRLGGILPLEFTDNKMGIVVRERREEAHGSEDLNYTVTNVKRSIAMNRMEDQRLLAIALAGGVKENVIIDIAENEKRKFQPIESIFGKVEIHDFKDLLAAATAKLLKDRFFPGNSLVLVRMGADETRAWSINMNLQQNNPHGAKIRWNKVKKFAKEIRPDIVALIFRKPGDAKEEKAIGVSVLQRSGEEDKFHGASKDFKIIMNKPQESDERIQEEETWRDTFDAQGGEERYAEFLQS